MVKGEKRMGMVSDREARGESSYVPAVTQWMRKKAEPPVLLSLGL